MYDGYSNTVYLTLTEIYTTQHMARCFRRKAYHNHVNPYLHTNSYVTLHICKCPLGVIGIKLAVESRVAN